MDDEARVSGSLNPPEKEKEKEDVRGPSYWLDACEDIPCHFIDDFVDLDAAAISEAADGISNPEAGPDPCFFGGIDQILDSIKNGDGLSLALNGNSDNDSAVIRHCVPVGPASVGNGDKQAMLCKMEVLEDSIGACQNTNYSNGLLGKFDDANKNDNGGPSDSDAATETCKLRETNSNGKKSSNHSPERNGVHRLETRGTDLYRDRDDEVSEGRYNKRARVNDYNCKTERYFQNRGQYRPKERERPSGRKRPRDWEDIDRRERDQIRRRERYGSGKRDCRDRDWRESKGFWERERPGSNEMVFHLGTWESERNREGKAPSERNQDCIVKVEKKPEEAKEKHPEEQARQYQLDVLEQAKQKNTIAFLETGAGKTLIAVLLIKSVCSDLQMQNRRMLAVFLVPKVPLVYQQAEVIREQTGYQVGHYCGEMGQDFWDARRWQREFETKQVLVMTAQILLNILRHSIIKMEAINLLILDECHHAVKKHPYSLVMSEFYHTTPKENRPSVFGMTASPVNLKGKFLEAKRPHLYWTPCAAHCMDLMLEDIFKLPNFKKTFERAIGVHGYIYNRPSLLNMMRSFTQLKELVKPAKTRFATAFLTLQRLYQQRNNLRKMFTSEEWTKSKWAKEPQGKKTAQIMLMPSFWNHVHLALQFSCPLVHVLRMVDGEEKPPMGYIYEAMDRAKEAIANAFDGKEEKYKEIFEIIDQRWDIQLHRPLHAAGFYLNPSLFYKDPNAAKDKEIMTGLYQCISRLIPTLEVQDKVCAELTKYEKAEGLFQIPMAIRQRSTRAPGVSSQVDCAIKIRNLETKLDSVVCTIKDRKELEKHVPMPSEIVVEYDKAASLWSLHEQIKQIELAVEEAAQSSSRRSKWQFMGARDAGAKEELRQVYGVSERTESDGAANLIQKLRAINYALGELGQWCAYKVAQSFLTALQNDERANYQLDVKFQESYLSEVVTLLQCQLSEGAVSENSSKNVTADNDATQGASDLDEIEEGELPGSHVVSGGEHVDVIIGAAVADGKVTPKVQSLIKILLKYQHTEDFRAIIFVERVVAALVLPKVFAELPSLSFVKSASLIGHNNSQEMRTSQMQDTIGKFRDGRVTLLVATSVAEEGLDIRQCNVVIRFDLAKTVLAYIQSRGRARKPGSDYILMVERGNLSHEAFLRNARNSEETLRKEAVERTDLSHLKGTSRLISVDTTPGTVYQVESTGAVVSLNSAVGLIHFYCSQLPSDRYSILRPEFIMERHEMPGGSIEYSCRLQLPCNAPFEKLEGPVCSSMRLAQQAVCLAACQKLHEMGAFTDMLLPDKGSGEEGEKVDQNDEGDPLPGTARHREFYPEGVANILQGEWILSGRDACYNSKLFHLYMYDIECVDIGSSKDPFLTQVLEFAVVFGNELDAEVLSMSMDLFIARTMITKASLVFRGSIDITESQLASLKSFHVRLMSIVLDVDVEPSTTPWDPSKAYLFVPVVGDNSVDPLKEIDWDLVEKISKTDAWNNPLQRARPDVYLGTNERTLGGDRREYGFGKLRHGMAFGQKSHPTYGIRGAVAQFDIVKASGLVPNRNAIEIGNHLDLTKRKLMMADSFIGVEDLVGRIVTAAHSGKRFYVDSVRYDMTAENSFPRKEGYLGPLEYSSYADYYRQKYGVELIYKQQPLIRGRGVSYCKNLLSPRFEHSEANEGESEEALDKTYYVFLPPELCFVHPLPGSLVRGAQRLPSIMRRVESMLLAIQLKDIINYPVPASKILEALTAASCQETFCYERAELLGDAYLKWVVSRFLFLKYPQKHEGQLTRMRQQMVSNMVLYQYALNKGLQSYIQADRFAPSRWAAPGVLPVFDEDIKETGSSLFDNERALGVAVPGEAQGADGYEDDEMEDGELESDSSSYRVLSSKTLADVVEALIGIYYVEGGKKAANHLMKWIGIQIDFDPKELECTTRPSNVPESILRSINFDGLEGALNIKFKDRGLLVEAITHASRPSSGVSCYQRLEFVGDAVLDHLITKHLFFTYTDLPPGRLTDLRAAAVNNENFARVAVKHKLHLHLRHGSSALEKQIRDFVKEVQDELSKPGFNSFGLGDCKAPKVLGDIVESIAGAIFLDSGRDTAVVWRVFQPLLHPMVTPETLPMHPVRELQERCQQQAEGLEYKATRSGNLATVEVFIDGVQVGIAQNPQKKMAQKLAARNALVALKERETAEAKGKASEDGKRKNGSQTFTRQTLNDICLRRNWPMPLYRCVSEGGPAHAKRFTFAVRVNTTDRGWTDECIGEPMPSVKKAKDSAAVLLLELLNKLYP